MKPPNILRVENLHAVALATVTGPFIYICSGCRSSQHLALGPSPELTQEERQRFHGWTTTFANLNGPAFRSYYCARSLGLWPSDYQDLLHYEESNP